MRSPIGTLALVGLGALALLIPNEPTITEPPDPMTPAPPDLRPSTSEATEQAGEVSVVVSPPAPPPSTRLQRDLLSPTVPDPELVFPSYPDGDNHTFVRPTGKKIHIITTKPSGFESLYSIIRKLTQNSKSVVVIDRHFNKYRGNASGPLLIHNRPATRTAHRLLKAYEALYNQNGWTMTHNRAFLAATSEWRSLSMIRLANKYGIACIVEEIAFIDDPHQGEEVRDFIRSPGGHEVIARLSLGTLLNEDLGFDHIVLCAGHHRSAGASPSHFDSYTETRYAFDTFEWTAALCGPFGDQPETPPSPSLPLESPAPPLIDLTDDSLIPTEEVRRRSQEVPASKTINPP